MTTITSFDQEPIDLVLWRNGRRASGEFEAAFNNNPGLAARPPILPARVAIQLPDQPLVQVIKTVKLWD